MFFFSVTFRSAGKLKGKMKLSAGRTKGHLQGEFLFSFLFLFSELTTTNLAFQLCLSLMAP